MFLWLLRGSGRGLLGMVLLRFESHGLLAHGGQFAADLRHKLRFVNDAQPPRRAAHRIMLHAGQVVTVASDRGKNDFVADVQRQRRKVEMYRMGG